MVKYTDYTVLCCFVFPLGFPIPTLLARFEGREEREKALCCIPLRHKECQGGCRAGGAMVNSITLQEVGKGPQTSPSSVLLFWEADGFLLSLESFPHGKDWAHWEASGNLEASELMKPRSKTKPYRRALAGRITFLRSSHGDSPVLRQNRGRIDFRQLLRWPSSPGLLCLWGGPSVFPSALAHVTLVSLSAEIS